MGKVHECPKCGKEMEYQEDEPDVGITGGWYCRECDYAELAEYGDEDDYLL
mgnify:FL=1